MSRFRHVIAIAAAAAFIALWSGGLRAGAAETDVLAVIVNPKTPVTQLSARELEAIFSQSMQHWDDGATIVPLNYAPGTPMRVTFDRAVLGMNPDEIARFWIDRRIRGQGDAPRKIPSSGLMLRVVANLRGCIGYVPAALLDDSVKVVAMVKNGRVEAPGSN